MAPYDYEEEDDESDEDSDENTTSRRCLLVTGSLLVAVGVVALAAAAVVHGRETGESLVAAVAGPGTGHAADLLTFNCTLNTSSESEFHRCFAQKKMKLMAKIQDMPVEQRENFEEFLSFLRQYKRDYFGGDRVDVEQFRSRLRTFGQTLLQIKQRNEEAKLNNLSIRHGITHFADLTQEEFYELLGARLEANSSDDSSGTSDSASERRLRWGNRHRWPSAASTSGSGKAPPCSKQWSSRGTVRNQGACGNCWAFSAVEAIRAATIQQTGKDPGMLSTQYLTNCMYQSSKCKGGVGGCCGGNPATAFQFIKKQGGIPTQEAYGNVFSSQSEAEGSGGLFSGQTSGIVSPTGKGITYTGNFPTKAYQCKQGIRNSVKLQGWASQLKKEDDMGDYVCKTGSLSVLVDASQWNTYAGGVMTAKACGESINHAVLAMGVIQSKKAWIIQNSWGPDWGVSVDGTPVPTDKYSNCDQLAGFKKRGCNKKLTTGETVASQCQVSCGADNAVSGGYILLEYGSDACGITTQADVVPTVSNF